MKVGKENGSERNGTFLFEKYPFTQLQLRQSKSTFFQQTEKWSSNLDKTSPFELQPLFSQKLRPHFNLRDALFLKVNPTL